MDIYMDIYIYICTTDSLHCTPETNTTLYINYSPKKKKKDCTAH